jgi:hypothetical protein
VFGVCGVLLFVPGLKPRLRLRSLPVAWALARLSPLHSLPLFRFAHHGWKRLRGPDVIFHAPRFRAPHPRTTDYHLGDPALAIPLEILRVLPLAVFFYGPHSQLHPHFRGIDLSKPSLSQR